MKAPWSRSRQTRTTTTADVVTRALLISVQPRFANAILEGTKTIELRRTMPTLPPAALALIYSSSPTKALVGWATVEDIVRASPRTLWREHRDSTGVTSAEFKDYFAGSAEAFGIRLGEVRQADHQIDLTVLRTYGLEPPQSWRYVANDLARTLRQEMTGAARGARPYRSSRDRRLAEIVG